MLADCGAASLEDLFSHLPSEVRLSRPLDIAPGQSEYDIVDYFRARGDDTAAGYASFLGAGVYRHYRPVVVDAGVGRDLRGDDAGRRSEVVDVVIVGERRGALHELGPCRQSRRRPGKVQLAVVVVTHPNHGEQIRGEAGEPAVMTGTRLARGRQLEAATAHTRRRPVVDDGLHQADHQIRDARVKHAPRGLLALAQRAA